MLNLPANFDAISMAQLSALMGRMTPEEFARARGELVRRFGKTADLPAAVEAEPNNLVAQLLRNGFLFSGFSNLVASPANNNNHAVFNPAGSGVRILVFEAHITPLTAALVRLSFINSSVGYSAVTGTNQSNNLNQAAGLVGNAALLAGNQAVGITNFVSEIDRRQGAAATTLAFNLSGQQPYVELAEGTGIVLTDNTVNELSFCGFIWGQVPTLAPSVI